MEDIKIYTQQNEEGYCEKYFNLETVTSLLVLTAATYNIVFVPLSFGFRIKFQGVFMVLEILTVFFYVVDICMRWSKLNHLKTLKKLPDSKLKSEDRKMKNDPEMMIKCMWI